MLGCDGRVWRRSPHWACAVRSPRREFGGEVVRRIVPRVAACAWVLVASGCGALTTVQTSTSPTTRTAPAVPATPSTLASGPCSNVATTTPIEDVALACQELWLPYDVTAVPPSNELAIEHVPHAPTVVNMTDGAVSDVTAQRWADASNADSGWWKWAQANGQLFVLRHLVGPALIPVAEVEALQNGGTVDQPDCNLYPISTKLFAVGDAGKAYFARKHLPTDDTYLFVVVYHGPCSETLKTADGLTTSIVDFTENTTVFTPGVFRSDPVLGDLWFGDAGGNCQDPLGPPPAWCGR
jgi:hypothetical protein